MWQTSTANESDSRVEEGTVTVWKVDFSENTRNVKNTRTRKLVVAIFFRRDALKNSTLYLNLNRAFLLG